MLTGWEVKKGLTKWNVLIHSCCFLRTREAQVVQKCRLHESSLQSQMALQRVRPWPARLLRRRPRVPIVSHAASETLSNRPWWKFCLVLQTVCCLSPHHHLHWYLAEIFGMSCWFFPLLLTLSWPLVSSLLSCSFLLFLCPSLDFSCVGGFCHLFCSGWLRMKKCQWSLCMELLREIKERGYDSVTKTFVLQCLIFDSRSRSSGLKRVC